MLMPVKNSIGQFLEYCFYDFEAGTYRNLSEYDRKKAYFYGFTGTDAEWGSKQKEYESKYPRILNTSTNIGPISMQKVKVNEFGNLQVSESSIKILNDGFFEYKLAEMIDEFKRSFNLIIDIFLKSKKHELFALNDRFEHAAQMKSKISNKEIDLKGLNKIRFFDAIDSANDELKNFLDVKFKTISSQIESPESLKNYDSSVFTSEKNFQGFQNYLKNDFKYPLKDISYLKKRMILEKRMHQIRDFQFMGYLKEKMLINDVIYNEMVEHGQLDPLSKSYSKYRLAWYNAAFSN